MLCAIHVLIFNGFDACFDHVLSKDPAWLQAYGVLHHAGERTAKRLLEEDEARQFRRGRADG